MSDRPTSPSRFRRSPDAVEAEVAGLTVLLDAEAGAYDGLDEVGSTLGARLAEPRALTNVVTALVALDEMAEA